MHGRRVMGIARVVLACLVLWATAACWIGPARLTETVLLLESTAQQLARAPTHPSVTVRSRELAPQPGSARRVPGHDVPLGRGAPPGSVGPRTARHFDFGRRYLVDCVLLC